MRVPGDGSKLGKVRCPVPVHESMDAPGSSWNNYMRLS
jgi:hypothetical protein